MALNDIPDPRLIPQTDLPLIVLANKTNDFIAGTINLRTNGSWDHAMTIINQGKFCTQGLTYSEVPMEDYLKRGGQLKFIKLVNSNPEFNQAFKKAVLSRLGSPWWHKFYDFIGIFGQAIGMPWIHTPGLMYCSVVDIALLKASCIYLPSKDQQIINTIPNESSPQSLDDIFKSNPGIFATYGIYLSDEGIIV